MATKPGRAGFEAAASPGEEARNTRRSIPKSTIGIVIVTGIFYLLVVLAEMFGVGRQDIPRFTRERNPLGYLTSQYWSPSALWAIELVVVLTGLGPLERPGADGKRPPPPAKTV